MRFKLICFDLDGTLIDDTEYIWSTLHDAFDVPHEIRRQYYSDFLEGRITYEEWFATDIQEWVKRGKGRLDLVRVIKQLRVMNGAEELLAKLRTDGYRLAIVSGSLDLVVETLLPHAHFDHVLINQIKFHADGRIAGGNATPYDMDKKADGLRTIAAAEGLDLSQCVFVGDNENDVQIAAAAGFTIAFNSKSERLNAVADVVAARKDLRDVRQLIGED
jgi:phosphoserine phosphatase